MHTAVVNERSSPDPGRQAQRDEVTTQTRLEHGNLLLAIHRLEEKVAAAAPGRERRWASDVIGDLRKLRDSMRVHVESSGSDDGLFRELEITVPTRVRRMERLQQRQDGLLQQMNALISQLENHDSRDVPDFSDIRGRIATIIDEVRTVQALENDLIYECFHTDIGVGD